MKNCCPDGELRAYIDGEMTLDARVSIAAHLEVCSACSARHREIAERAAWVSAVMDLPETPPAISAARRRPRQWLVGAMGLAAALCIAFLVLPKRSPVRPAPERPAPVVAKVVVPPARVQAAVPAVHPVVHSAVGHPAPHRQESAEEFLRLDDEPIETATIVRVSAENGALQAELIVGPDGRTHAIRVVRNR